MTKPNGSSDFRARFFDLSLDMMVVCGYDGYFKELNEVWEKIIGFTTAEIRAEPFMSFVYPDDREATREAFQRLLEGVPVVAFENRYRCKDGSFKWIQWHCSTDVEEQVVFGLARDVTGQKRLDQELKIRETRYRSLVETAHDLIFSIDREGNWSFVNQAAERIYGYTPAELIGRPVSECYAGQMSDADVNCFTRVLAGEPAFQYETTHRRRDGSLAQLLFNVLPLRSEDGAVIGVTGTASDITERKRAEERLMKQAEAIRSMATPIIQVWDGVIAMPIIGVVDSQRAAQVMEALLREIVRTRTRFAILDLTGVEIMDTSTANYLLQMVRAVALLGGTCIVSGIAPAIASTIVGLGIEMTGLLTFGTLQAALRYAIRTSNEDRPARARDSTGP